MRGSTIYLHNTQLASINNDETLTICQFVRDLRRCVVQWNCAPSVILSVEGSSSTEANIAVSVQYKAKAKIIVLWRDRNTHLYLPVPVVS